MPINSEAPYEALSYTWGPENPNRCIEVEGDNSLRSIFVGYNLFTALFHLRYVDRCRRVWIDAISIDQSNITERGHQVAMMSQIYKQAERVIVWLGVEKPRGVLSSWVPAHPAGTLNAHRERDLDISDADWSRYAIIMEIFQSRWFTRAWVMQEVVHANEIVVRYGATDIPWEKLVCISTLIDKGICEISDEIETCIASARTVLTMQHWRESFQTSLQAEDVIYEARQSQCLDPRDKIFSALSLIPKTDGSLLIIPDYHKHLLEVQNILAKSSILLYQSLNILRYVEHTSDSIDLPSWAPRWRFGDIAKILKPLNNANHDPAFCQIPHKTAVQVAKGPEFRINRQLGKDHFDVLRLRSKLLLEIGCVTKGIESIRTPPTFLWPLVQLNLEDASAFQAYNNRQVNLQISHLTKQVFDSSYIKVTSDPERSTGSSLPKYRLGAWHWRSPLDSSLDSMLRGRQIAATHRGCLVIVPKSTKPGDIIVALQDIRLPFVVRPQGSYLHNMPWYILIGAREVDAEIERGRLEEDEHVWKDTMLS
ncbi:hypothetical protein MMC17_003177 [Xylographa soralifera]|nr:hypothetical protein [Xylographa soralifera]